jgi:hypothetical protein
MNKEWFIFYSRASSEVILSWYTPPWLMELVYREHFLKIEMGGPSIWEMKTW